MPYDLKTASPDTTLASGAFLFGADSQSATNPSVYSVDTAASFFSQQMAAGYEALAMLNGREGFACNFLARSAAIRHWSDPTKNFIGRPEQILSLTRASTATDFNASGVLETVAVNGYRYDYNPSTLAPRGLLLEPSRTNLYLNSATATGPVAFTLTSDTHTAPDGTATADLLTEDTSTAERFQGQNISVTSGTTYSWSRFVKVASGTRHICLRVTTAATALMRVDPATWTVAATSGANYVASSVTALPNSWYRLDLVFTAASTGNALCVVQTGDGATLNYAGNGSSGIYVWGAQVEAGAGATSYVATTSATVARSADNSSMLTSLLPYISTAGTLFAEFEWRDSADTTSTDALVRLSSSDTDRVFLRVNNALVTSAVTFSGNVNQATIDSTSLSVGVVKSALSFANNSVRLSFNGASGTEDTSATLPAAATQLSITSNFHSQSAVRPRWLRRLMYLPQQLSQTDLNTLTT